MSDRDQDILDAIAGRHPNGANKVRANCPRCESVVGKVDRRQCLELDAASGWWKCYRCGSRGKLGEVPYDISTLPTPAAKEDRPAVSLPEGFCPLWTEAERHSEALKKARKYLRSRVGVTPEVIAAARIGACVRGDFAGRVVVPIYSKGKLAGYVGRSWNKKADLKYRYSTGFDRANVLYNEEALYQTSRWPALIVEGVFDTFPFWRPKQPLSDGVAMLGKLSPAQFTMLLAARRPILFAADGDAHREAEALTMQLALFGKHAASLKLPPTKDPDEVHEQVKLYANRMAFEEHPRPLTDLVINM